MIKKLSLFLASLLLLFSLTSCIGDNKDENDTTNEDKISYEVTEAEWKAVFEDITSYTVAGTSVLDNLTSYKYYGLDQNGNLAYKDINEEIYQKDDKYYNNDEIITKENYQLLLNQYSKAITLVLRSLKDTYSNFTFEDNLYYLEELNSGREVLYNVTLKFENKKIKYISTTSALTDYEYKVEITNINNTTVEIEALK